MVRRRESFLPYARQQVQEEDIAEVARVLRSDYLTTGPEVELFERAFAEFVGARYAVAVSSGTAALHAALHAAGIGLGAEVICPPLTFCATANAAIYLDATPVFADIEPETFNLDPVRVAEAITSNTRALLPVDYAGHPANLAELRNLANDYDLVLIEDACHAHGASLGERMVGSISDITCFSFHPVKHMTTAEGGICTTNDEELARRMRAFRSHGIDLDAKARQARGVYSYDMVELGYNYRLSDVGAALGRSQLGRLEENVKRRRAIAARYNELLAGLAPLRGPVELAGATSSYHLYTVLLDDSFPLPRDEVLTRLRELNVGGNVHYPPVHLHTYYRERFGYAEGDFPIAEEIANRVISLPMFHAMSDTDVEDVVAALRHVLESA